MEKRELYQLYEIIFLDLDQLSYNEQTVDKVFARLNKNNLAHRFEFVSWLFTKLRLHKSHPEKFEELVNPL